MPWEEAWGCATTPVEILSSAKSPNPKQGHCREDAYFTGALVLNPDASSGEETLLLGLLASDTTWISTGHLSTQAEFVRTEENKLHKDTYWHLQV